MMAYKEIPPPAGKVSWSQRYTMQRDALSVRCGSWSKIKHFASCADLTFAASPKGRGF